MYSDNGTNFKGADKELKSLISQLGTDKIKESSANKGIQWHFNPPLAPHFGGAHEHDQISEEGYQRYTREPRHNGRGVDNSSDRSRGTDKLSAINISVRKSCRRRATNAKSFPTWTDWWPVCSNISRRNAV